MNEGTNSQSSNSTLSRLQPVKDSIQLFQRDQAILPQHHRQQRWRLFGIPQPNGDRMSRERQFSLEELNQFLHQHRTRGNCVRKSSEPAFVVRGVL